MKTVFISHCQNDWYFPIGAQKLKNSARYFHPDIQFPIHGDNIINEVKIKYPWSSWYTFDPLIAEYYIDEYELIVHIDADSLVTGPLDELLLGDFDIAGVRNNNDIGLTSRTGGVNCSATPGRDRIPDSLNAGLIASTSKAFWAEFKERNRTEAAGYPFGEQCVFNRIFWEGKYKAKMLDPVGSNVYYGTSQMICEGNILETAWKRLYMQNGELYSDNKKVKIIHNADGHRIPKLQYQNYVNPDVRNFLDTITR